MIKLRNIDADALNEIAKILSATRYDYYHVPKITNETTELAQTIFGTQGIFLFEKGLKENINTFESTFNAFISNVAYNHFAKRGIDDEVKVLKSVYTVDRSFLTERNIIMEDSDDQIYKYYGAKKAKMELLQRLPINRKELIMHTSNADYIEKVDSTYIPGLSMIFTTKRISDEKILLSVLIGKNNTVKFDLFAAFIYSYAEYYDMIASPARFFLKSLDYYGEMVSINGINKKFWYHEYINTLDIKEVMDKVKLRHDIKEKEAALFIHLHKNIFSISASFIFSFNASKYFNDLQEGRV